MKHKLVLSFLAIAFTALSAPAQTEEILAVNAGNLEHITISNDLDVVLLPATGDFQPISLDAGASEKLGVQFSGNAMTISSPGYSTKDKFRVHLYVNNLKTLVIENDATVKTSGVIKAPKLDLFVGAGAKVHLKTSGSVKPHSINDSEISVKYLLENGLVKQGMAKTKLSF